MGVYSINLWRKIYVRINIYEDSFNIRMGGLCFVYSYKTLKRMINKFIICLVWCSWWMFIWKLIHPFFLPTYLFFIVLIIIFMAFDFRKDVFIRYNHHLIWSIITIKKYILECFYVCYLWFSLFSISLGILNCKRICVICNYWGNFAMV